MMGKKISKIYLVVLIAVMPLLITSCKTNDSYPAAEMGIMDIAKYDFSQSNIRLDGEWEFYWKRMVDYDDLQLQSPDTYGHVPGIWNKYWIQGRMLSGQGYGTYRLRVKTNRPRGSLLGLSINTFSSSYKLYINGELVASNGSIASEADLEIGEYRPKIAIFSVPDNAFDIIVQVSNFQHNRGGFWNSLIMGTPEEIYIMQDRVVFRYAFLMGTLIVGFFLYLVIYLLRRELRYTLYFAIFCLLAAIISDILGQLIIMRSFPGLSLASIIFIWYSLSNWALFFLIIFLHELFPSKFSRVVVKMSIFISSFIQLLYLFTAPSFFTRIVGFINFIGGVSIIISVIITIIGIRNKKSGGWLHIISMLVLLATYIHDVLLMNNLLRSGWGEMVFIGIFTFVLIHMFILARNIKIFHQNKIDAELAIMQAQIKPHFLYNALNTFISISYYDIEKARNLIIQFGNYLRRSFDFKSASQLVPFKNEIELVKSYLEIEKARFEERIEVVFDIPDDIETSIPILMLQPVVENSIIHGILPKNEGGLIEIIVKKDNKALYFTVRDNGVGIEEARLENIFEQKYGSGIGLSNIDNRLRKLYGKNLKITSTIGEGTIVNWSVPIRSKESV